MTCVVGLVDGSILYMGADSAGVSGTEVLLRADSKLFRNGNYLMGFTSSFRMGQLLRHAFTPPTPPLGADLAAFMCTTFIDAVRTCLKNGGFATKEKEAEVGGIFLVGYQSKLFRINSDYQVEEFEDRFAACGCGEQYALGALFANARKAPAARIREALRAAETFSTSVRAPFRMLHFDSTSPAEEAPAVVRATPLTEVVDGKPCCYSCDALGGGLFKRHEGETEWFTGLDAAGQTHFACKECAVGLLGAQRVSDGKNYTASFPTKYP